MKQIVLASQSPRRRELLEQLGLEFTIQPSTVEEKVTSEDPVEVVRELSRQKAQDVADQMEKEHPGHDMVVLGADTIVVYKGIILGKPADRDDAEKMLHMLQGNTHSVYTGVTLIGKGKSVTFAEETKVTMYPVSHEEITWYIETKEPDDKAGSYAVQGLGARFIQKIEGDYNNVVGLPAGRIYQILRNWEE